VFIEEEFSSDQGSAEIIITTAFIIPLISVSLQPSLINESVMLPSFP
jgi:hypothetical protein